MPTDSQQAKTLSKALGLHAQMEDAKSAMHRTITPLRKQRDRLIYQLFLNGWTYEELCGEFSCARMTIATALKRARRGQ